MMSIARRKRICYGCGIENYIFSHNLCKRCWANPQKRVEANLRPLKRLSRHKPPKTPTNIKTPYFSYNSQLEMFFDLWDKYPRDEDGRMYCEFTGLRIDTFEDSFRWLNCFSHVLPKGLYPAWKLNSSNIRLVHPDFHYATEYFTSDMREKHPSWRFDEWFALVEKLKKEYKNFVDSI